MKKPPTVALISLGCPKNLVDSEKLLALMAEGDCTVGAGVGQADVIVVNTCGFLEAARQESLGAIREALELKRQGKASRVVVAGCMVNRDAGELFKLAPGIDAIVGVNDREAIVAAAFGRKKTAVTMLPPRPATTAEPGGATEKTGRLRRLHGRDARDTHGRDAHATAASDSGRFRLTPRHTAYLRISEGCSQRCTFCTIPGIRGPFRSKLPEDVLAEARELAADGAVELNIIGQDTTSYGRDLEGKPSLASLLRQVAAVVGVRWVRLMYAYPKRFSEELVDTIAATPNIVKYVDIPLQHIADGVLRRMGRYVTRDTTLKLLARLREISGMTIRTTFIVGFPGETDGDFRELLDFVESFRFDALGVFEYSPEAGTPAAKMPNQIDPAVKAERARQIMLAQQRIAFAANRKRAGERIEVLVDGQVGARTVARHPGQAPEIDSVCYLTAARPAGSFVRGTILKTQGYDLVVRPSRRGG